jgi:hypothetical protein
MGFAMKANWFNTLNEALEAESLVHLWPVGKNIGYGETASFAQGGRWVSVYRETNGRYERPVHYATQMPNTYHVEPAEVAGRSLQL